MTAENPGDTPSDTPNYKDTLFLPKTDFPMRAGLPKREPEWLARWEGIYDRLRAKACPGRDPGPGRKPFVLHDGPPYANGHLHIGHALNKIMKDMVVRSAQMLGFDSRSNGRSRSSTAKRARTRTRSRSTSCAPSAAISLRAGSISSATSSSALA
jgi:isoleucyl-tRNA synthetase